MPTFQINVLGMQFANQPFRIFVMAAFHAVSIYSRLKISEYKVQWLMDFLLINNCARAKKELLLFVFNMQTSIKAYNA